MSSFNPFGKFSRPPSVPLKPGNPAVTDPVGPVTGGIAGTPITGVRSGVVGGVTGVVGGVTSVGGVAGSVGGASGAVLGGAGAGGLGSVGTVGGSAGGLGGIGVVGGVTPGATASPAGGVAGTIGELPLTGVVGVGTVGAPSAVGGAAAAGITSKAAGAFAAGAFSHAALSQIVQIGQEPVSPVIVRGGEEVTAPPLNTAKVDDLVGRLVPILRVRVPRSVSQSIAPGTMVAKGTPIDIVLVPVSDIDFSVFEGAHDDLKALSVESVLPLLVDPAIVPILQKADPATLTDAEKTTLGQKAQAMGVTVDDTVATKSTATFFSSLKNAKAFQ